MLRGMWVLTPPQHHQVTEGRGFVGCQLLDAGGDLTGRDGGGGRLEEAGGDCRRIMKEGER